MPFNCHKSRTKVIAMANQEKKENIFTANENNETALEPPNCHKHGEMWATKLWLVLVLYLIGWDGGTTFLDQSQSEVKQNQCYVRLLSTLNWNSSTYHYLVCLGDWGSVCLWFCWSQLVMNFILGGNDRTWSWLPQTTGECIA